MNYSLWIFNWIVLLVLGGALHWMLHLVYGGRRARSNDTLMLVLTITAWLLIMAGTLGPLLLLGGAFGLILFVAFFEIAIVAVEKYRDVEKRSLMWVLAVAAEREVPLAEAARSFAADRTDEIGRRADRLADLVEDGTGLPDALATSGNLLPIDVQLAARLGHETGHFQGAMKEAAHEGGRLAAIWEPVIERLLYLVVLLLFGIGMLAYLMIKIMPNMQAIFDDFDAELPAITELAIHLSDLCLTYSFVWSLVILGLIVLSVYGVLCAAGLIRWEPIGVAWFTRRFHGAIVLRSLAQAVERSYPLDRAFELLAQWYPRGHVRDRLLRAKQEIEQGANWCDALQRCGLLARSSAAVLRAAERVGNLPWALREMSESTVRRMSRRVALVTNLTFPLAVLVIGGGVGLYVLAVMMPLIDLIQSLT
jgi:type II secretory pathway component PulF